jgi:DNA-directed RNA polymerase specialized sigma24 family protein
MAKGNNKEQPNDSGLNFEAPLSATAVGALAPEVFATTHWSLILDAGGLDSQPAAKAWEILARSYWSPLYRYVRRRGYQHHDAEDLIQAFFARLLEKNVLRDASQSRGRFRSFLLSSLSNFLANEHDRASALKRGGKQPLTSLDQQEFEIPAGTDGISPEKLFDRAWAETLVARTFKKLEEEFSADGKHAQFLALKPFLSRPPSPGEYDSVAAGLEIRPALMATAVSRLRHRFRQLMRSEIAHTVARLPEVDDEMRYLVSVLAS